MILENNEEKRSTLWRTIVAISSILIVIVAVFFVTRLFVGNPLVGTWVSDRIVAAVKEAGMYDDTIFIITSDHGGIKKGHGGKTMAEMQTPFIIAGKNIKKAGEFQESMVQYDVAATMAYIFGLEQPQVWTGRAMKQVFK